MAKNEVNLKTNVGADTSGFTKGMSQVRRELKAFDSTTNSVLSKIAGAFGVNISQVQKLQEAFDGAGRKIAKMGEEGSKSLGAVVASAGKAATAIGAIGIGAAVTAFKLLNAEAEAFRNTVAGANIELQTQAYLSTYKQAMHDVNEDIGRNMAENQAKMQKWWGTLPGRLATNTMGPGGMASTFATMGAYSSQQMQALGAQTEAIYDEAISKAERAEQIAGELYNLQLEQNNATRRWADMEKEISEYRLLAYDQEASASERRAALANMQELITKKYNEQYEFQKRISELTDENNDLASSSVEDVQKANQLYVQSVSSLAQMNNELKSLERLSKQIATSAAAEAKSRQETAAAIATGVSRMQEYATASIEMTVSEKSTETLTKKLQEAVATSPLQVPVGIDTKKAEEAALNWSETIQQTLTEGVEGLAESIGTLLGNVMTGEGGMAQFGEDLLSMVGTFAQKFGKVLIAFGVASEAFKESLSTLDGIKAIAAGAALVVAGAAVKAVASNMASSVGGASSASSYVASSSYGGGGGYANSTLQVEVTGTLTANGSQLVAVLNNENNRTHYTT